MVGILVIAAWLLTSNPSVRAFFVSPTPTLTETQTPILTLTSTTTVTPSPTGTPTLTETPTETFTPTLTPHRNTDAHPYQREANRKRLLRPGPAAGSLSFWHGSDRTIDRSRDAWRR